MDEFCFVAAAVWPPLDDSRGMVELDVFELDEELELWLVVDARLLVLELVLSWRPESFLEDEYFCVVMIVGVLDLLLGEYGVGVPGDDARLLTPVTPLLSALLMFLVFVWNDMEDLYSAFQLNQLIFDDIRP